MVRHTVVRHTVRFKLCYLALAKFSDRKFTDFLGEREGGGTMITGFDYPYF
jgi:hypothetical protein